MQSNFLRRRFLSIGEAGPNSRDENKFEDVFSQDVLDIRTVRDLCLGYGFPDAYRSLGWKILLGILPPRRHAWELTENALKTMYEEMRVAALCVCENRYNRLTEKERNILQTYLFRRRMPKRVKLAKRETFPALASIKRGLRDDQTDNFSPILRVLLEVFDTEYEAFWALDTLWDKYKRVARGSLGTPMPVSGVRHRCRYLSELLMSRNPTLRKALNDVGISEDDYAEGWFRSIFSDSFRNAPSLCLELWDSLLALPVDFIVYVAYVLVTSMEKKILQIINRAGGDSFVASRGILEAFRSPTPFSTDVKGILKKAFLAAPEYMLHENLDHEANKVIYDMEWPTCKVGDQGSTLVHVIQHLLKARGFRFWFTLDGYYGPRTERAIENLKASASNEKLTSATSCKKENRQSLDELSSSPHSAPRTKEPRADARGVVGPATWPRLIMDIRTGVKGNAVKALQVALLELHGYDNVRVDGFYGRQTYKAVIDFQKNRALNMIPIDGWVGPVTWIHLLGYSKTSEDST